MATIFERLQKIFSEQLGINPEQVVAGASFADDFNADAEDIAELFAAFEEEFSSPDLRLEIPVEDAEEMSTVGELVDYLRDAGVKE